MIVLYGKINDDLSRVNNVKKIKSYIDDHGVIVEFQDGSTKWYDYIEVVNYE